MKLRHLSLSTVGLLTVFAANLSLLVYIVAEVASDRTANSSPVDWSANLPNSFGNVASGKQIEAYQQILARPIFSKSRAPFVPAPATPPAALTAVAVRPVVDPGLVLGGVMIRSDIRKAYVLTKANASGTWASIGDEFMGWRVSSITVSGAKLEQNGRSVDLQLYPKQ